MTAVGSDRPRAYGRPNRGAARRDREPTTPRASHDPAFIDGPPLDDGSLVDFDGFDTRRRSAWRTMETTETGSVATRPRPDVLPDATAVMDRVATRACGVSQKILGCVAAAWWVSRFRLLSDAQWSLIADLLPVRTGRQGRPFRDARQVVEGIICRYRCGIALRSHVIGVSY